MTSCVAKNHLMCRAASCHAHRTFRRLLRRRVRQKTPQATQVIEHKGKQITVYKGTHAAEDTRWVLILDG